MAATNFGSPVLTEAELRVHRTIAVPMYRRLDRTGAMARTDAFTLGFGRTDQLLDHFSRHGVELGLRSVEDYCWRADEFLGGLKGLRVVECTRRGGDRVRYDTETHEFGTIDMNSKLRTFYRVRPHLRNLSYFRAKCAEH